MTPRNVDKRRVVGRAQTLDERLQRPADTRAYERDGDEWMATWREYVADDDPAAFESRLEIEGTSMETCRQRLHDRALPADEPLPEWVETLDELVERVENCWSADRSPSVEVPEDVPFADVLAPFVAFASKRVDWEASSEYLSERVRTTLERWLLDRLSSIAGHTLFIEFKTFLASRDEELAFADDPEMPESPRRYYDQFVAELCGGGLAPFFEEYSTLGRIVVTLIEQWRDAVESFCERLRTDWDALAETFDSEGPLGRLMDLEWHGDHHRGGRLVFHLTFESELELAYKPRDLRPEARFGAFVSWVNAESDLLDLYAPDCLVREDYGWMAWADSEPCPTSDGVRRYYRRAGSMLCLLYALNFVDGHLENIVAAGEFPVVVDLETLMNPPLSESAKPPSNESSAGRRNSALATGILPEDAPNNDFKNMSGLDAPSGQHTGIETSSFERVNTDVMELRYENSANFSGDSLPRLDGEPIRPHDWSDEIEAGFAETYRFLFDNRVRLLADDGPVAAFSDVEFRYVFRPSMVYRTVLMPLTTPECHRTGRALGCKMERLAAPFVTGEADRDLWAVHEAERTALWRGDIPRFSVPADDTTLRHDGEVVEDVFDESPLERVRRRIGNLSETDLGAQLDLVETAYGSMPTEPSSTAAGWTGNPAERGEIESGRDADDALLGSSPVPERIFERVSETATTAPDGTRRWHRCEGGDEGVRVITVDDDFYGGRLGIAVFCAALAVNTDDATHRDFAVDVASSIRSDVEDGDPFSDAAVGAGSGIGSYVYGFTLLGELLDSDEYTETARRCSSELTPERFEDGTYDVMSGNAGAVLSLLALYDRTGDSELLTKAVAAGEQLLTDRVEVDGNRVWEVADDRISENRAAIGMAHGVGGVAYALTRLADATGDERFQNAASEAMEYEDAAYSGERRNWRNASPEMDEWPTGWCGGRSGVGLSRLGSYDVTGDESLRRDAERALDATDPDELEAFDHLCCGNFSRVEFLLESSEVLDEPRYADAARRLAAETVRRAEERGRFTVLKQTDHWFNPSLLQGEPGIGYTLLRFGDPELPCLALWE